jgi:hypothetical protein
MKRVFHLVAIAVFVLAAGVATRAQSNPLVGTWKLNLEKSKYDPGPAPKSLTRTVVADGDGVKYTFAGVAADGAAISYGFAVKFDGKDNPITGTGPYGSDSISAVKTDATHYVATVKKGGKAIAVSKVAVSSDGKTTTVEASGTNPAGAKTHDVQVWEKQ